MKPFAIARMNERTVTLSRTFDAPVIDVTLTESRGRTTVAVKAVARGPSDEAAAMLKGMDKGWAQTVERLDTLLRK